MSAQQLVNTLTWTFSAPCDIPSDVAETLIEGEKALHAFKTIRDVAVFTNKRIIVRDAQGITGKKWRLILFRIHLLKCIQPKMPGKF